MNKILAIALMLFVAIWFFNQNTKQGFEVDENVEIVFLAAAWCGYCKKTRKLLNKHNIPYVEYDIETTAKGKQYYEDLGKGGIPILIINGEVLRGYAPEQILQMSSLRTQ